jgi:CRISPR-associated protein Csm2
MRAMSEIGMKISTKAENCIKSLNKDYYGKPALSTSQIRKFLAGVNGLRNQVQVLKATGEITNKLTDEVVMEIDYLKIRLKYQSKEKNVRDFVDKSQMFQLIDQIGDSYKKFDQFCMYVEALVAYHKFEGGN